MGFDSWFTWWFSLIHQGNPSISPKRTPMLLGLEFLFFSETDRRFPGVLGGFLERSGSLRPSSGFWASWLCASEQLPDFDCLGDPRAQRILEAARGRLGMAVVGKHFTLLLIVV